MSRVACLKAKPKRLFREFLYWCEKWTQFKNICIIHTYIENWYWKHLMVMMIIIHMSVLFMLICGAEGTFILLREKPDVDSYYLLHEYVWIYKICTFGDLLYLFMFGFCCLFFFFHLRGVFFHFCCCSKPISGSWVFAVEKKRETGRDKCPHFVTIDCFVYFACISPTHRTFQERTKLLLLFLHGTENKTVRANKMDMVTLRNLDWQTHALFFQNYFFRCFCIMHACIYK